MIENYFEIDENATVGSFLREISDKKNMQYIILSTEPKSFVDVRTISLKMHNPNEKLKNLKKPLSKSKGKSRDEHTSHLIESGDRVIETDEGYFDFVHALDTILDNDYDFLEDSLNSIERKEVFALNEDDMIAEAKRMFVKNRINILPVIDNMEILGEVRAMDLLARELISSNEKNPNRGNMYDENYEKSVLNLPVSNIMNSRPLKVKSSEKFRDAVKLMRDKNIPSVIVTDDDGKLYSIVSYKDVFKKVKKDLEKGSYVIEYNGSNDLFDDEYDLIQDYVEKTMKKITKMSDYNLLKASFKVHGNKDESHQKKASVNLTLSCGNKILHVDKEISSGTADEIRNDKVKGKWNIPQMVQQALSALEKKVVDEKKKK